MLGSVEWVGERVAGGVAILPLHAAQPLALLTRKSGPFLPAQVLPLLVDLAHSLQALSQMPLQAEQEKILPVIARLLHPEAISIKAADSSLIFSPEFQFSVSRCKPPAWSDFIAPELYQPGGAGHTACVFGVAQVGAFLLGCGHAVPDPASEHARGSQIEWASLAEWASGTRDAATEFLEHPAAGELPVELREILGRCLSRRPARRPANLIRLHAVLKQLNQCPWAQGGMRCGFCGFTLMGPGVCPCCAPVNLSNTPASGSKALLPAVKTRKTTRLMSRSDKNAPLLALAQAPRGMSIIPAGAFLSGEQKMPRTLRAFAIDTLPVTESDYKKFLESSGKSARVNGPGSRSTALDTHPVTGVSWFEANEYAEHHSKRLPTVFEWEKAARGLDGRKYPFGNTFKPGCGLLRMAKRDEKKDEDELEQTTAPAGSYPSGASPFGVLDMAGNVLEWTWSARRTGERLFRAVKGACYLDGSAELARCTSIQYLPPESHEPFLGFRCVQDIE